MKSITSEIEWQSTEYLITNIRIPLGRIEHAQNSYFIHAIAGELQIIQEILSSISHETKLDGTNKFQHYQNFYF